MQRFHLIVGFVALAAFLASGQYMDLAYNHLRALDDARGCCFARRTFTCSSPLC
jgi:hypothetical protein